MTRPLPKVRLSVFRKNTGKWVSADRVGAFACRCPPGRWRAAKSAYCRRETTSCIEDAENTGPFEQHRHFGFRPDRCEAATGRNHPLQLVVHAKLGEAVTAMDDQRDRRRADAVEDPRHPGEATKMDVSRAERSDDQKIRQYECPSADPCPPEPAAQLRDEKAVSPLLGKKAKKSVEMCDVGHTWKKFI